MCFELYAGTVKQILRRAFDEHARALSVVSLTKEEDPIRAQFTMPEVQYIGSTSSCGVIFHI